MVLELPFLKRMPSFDLTDDQVYAGTTDTGIAAKLPEDPYYRLLQAGGRVKLPKLVEQLRSVRSDLRFELVIETSTRPSQRRCKFADGPRIVIRTVRKTWIRRATEQAMAQAFQRLKVLIDLFIFPDVMVKQNSRVRIEKDLLV